LAAGDTIWANYEQDSAYRVIASVDFSHGYYWYVQKNYDKAEELFRTSVEALKRADEKWDSPYTRLAIVELCKGNYKEAIETFLVAADICINMSIKRNREAPLSLALCTLGLKVIEISYPDVKRLTNRDPLNDLEEAIKKEPKFVLGPLECHRDDAKHFLIDKLESAEIVVNRFIRRLNQEIDAIKQ
jgi:tetratricopeptide (TPR) repeat protein